MNICTYIYIYVRTYIRMHTMYVHYVHMYVLMYIRTHAHALTLTHTYALYMYECMYVYACMNVMSPRTIIWINMPLVGNTDFV